MTLKFKLQFCFLYPIHKCNAQSQDVYLIHFRFYIVQNSFSVVIIRQLSFGGVRFTSKWKCSQKYVNEM